MTRVGDRIRLSANKGTDREGVVTDVLGSMVRVRWPSGEESTIVPAPGTLTVLSSAAAPAPKEPAPAAPKKAAPKKAAQKKAAPRKAVAKKAAKKKAAAKKAGGRKR